MVTNLLPNQDHEFAMKSPTKLDKQLATQRQVSCQPTIQITWHSLHYRTSPENNGILLVQTSFEVLKIYNAREMISQPYVIHFYG